MELDDFERRILIELIKNPRISDNKISQTTKIPVKTVNRKRKALESKGFLHYFCYLENGVKGANNFGAREMYVVCLRPGITKKDIFEALKKEALNKMNFKHLLESHIGEFDGYPAIVFVIESRMQQDIVEIFNAELVPQIKKYFGNDCIAKVLTMRIDSCFRMLHNYMPTINMNGGVIKAEFDSNLIFVE